MKKKWVKWDPGVFWNVVLWYSMLGVLYHFEKLNRALTVLDVANIFLESFLIPFTRWRQILNISLHYLFLFWTFSICSSTSFMDIFPRNMAATVRYLPWRGSQAAIMFLLSNIWWVNSDTVSARYCWLSRLVSGAKPGMKKCRRGNGTMFTANFLRSALS